MAAKRRCKDCPPDLARPRPAPKPGPRCVTHDRIEKRRVKEARHDTRQQKVYKLPPGGYQIIYRYQNGLCAICGPWSGRNGATRKLSTDHDHKTEAVRGLLCKDCNDMLGHARDLIEFFQRAIAYLSDPPAPRALAAPVCGPDRMEDCQTGKGGDTVGDH